MKAKTNFKVRGQNKVSEVVDENAVKEFVGKADKTSAELEVVLSKEVELDKNDKPFSDDPKAPRNYKLMTARFNKYEIEILDQLGTEFGVDRMNVLRIAYMALAKDKGII
ncbi:hypothetical protein bplSymb_SCF02606P001 [Bathymodiolus platifrons methanotrophic gill symbiont]|uniref:hypothetical protein n=1 Tax=unclassified Gammaproteobacteria TaxID=33811 RepID=UPI000B407D76|nr:MULTISPECIES: hypothetical protein [unclassified Gammaproteobacteria]GAW86419.1 hypothetical protein bplSymb_SCF02606P001 [Bathymodiolus platifrons methanotrophic gill symbiont]GFO72997.1 hypothetical protein BJAS_P3547 [Bathymodiolus japonicus methanotrophic gill symbiont]GFO77814.1 hypothetical protein BPLS_P6486 [Bathymodiolus platifrons methanotrophic gill symbiont]